VTEPFSPIARVVLVGEIEGEITRKTVNESALAEFRIAGVGLRISAWKDLAARVPASGLVAVEGALRTRTYQYEGKDRESVEITASSVTVIATAPEDELGF
jgi:hypothetical protein